MGKIEDKLQELISCIGEKKLKQLGLLTCHTCNHILEQIDDNISPEHLQEIIDEEAEHLKQTSEEQQDEEPSEEIILPVSPTEPIEDNSPQGDELGMGYIYSNVKPLPTHQLMCPECNRLYVLNEANQLIPLPPVLTHAEDELIKGVYVDILL